MCVMEGMFTHFIDLARSLLYLCSNVIVSTGANSNITQGGRSCVSGVFAVVSGRLRPDRGKWEAAGGMI